MAHDPQRTPLWDIGRLRLPLARTPLLMGIVNVTPDSFSDGGRYLDRAAAQRHALRLVEEGADLVDVGGESSRPGASAVSEEEELARVVPVIREIRAHTDVPLSIDTTKASVARAALEEGADIVNDISGLRFDAGMQPLLAASACGVVLMHMQGEPRTMQQAPHYDDVVREVRSWLDERLHVLLDSGIAGARVVVDPGIGFGKRYEDNVELLRHLEALRVAGRPLLIGASRKAFLGSLLQEPHPAQRLEGDLAVGAACYRAGVELLRVHDVGAARRFFRVLETLDPSA
ncbi:MAG: dihydropteroate synthase [Candidatus Latescibacterota bacterium]|nr:MAG: dihydropteroate synthase [Candidatus Latescibacterota bacterium]